MTLTRQALFAAIITMTAVPMTTFASPRDSFAAAIVDADSKVAKARKDFQSVLRPCQMGEPCEIEKLQSLVKAYATTLRQAAAAAQKLDVPPAADCRNLQRAFLSTVAAEEQHVLPELDTIVRKVVARQGKLDLLTKLEIVGALKKCQQAYEPAREQFTAAAREFDRADRTAR